MRGRRPAGPEIVERLPGSEQARLRLRVVLETLAGEPETLLARVSGSGGTCFALCGSDIEAESLAERIEAIAPEWWVERCRLGGPWPDEA